MNKDSILFKLFLYFSIVVFSIIAIIFTVKSYILLAIMSYLIVIFISFKINIKKFPLILFIISLLIRLILIKIINYSSFDDYKTLIEASWKFAKGDYSFNTSTYFSMWGYQTGLVIYQGIILKIFNSEFAIKVFNAIFSSLTVLLVYYISKKITNEKTAKVVSLLYMVLPISLILNAMLNNQILSALLMYLGIYLLIKKDKTIKDYIYAAILISIGNIIRPEGIVVVFSLLVFELLKLKKNIILDISKKLLVFLVIYISIGSISSFVVQKSNINPIGLKNTNSLWKFVVGFNSDSCGYYNADDEKYIQDKELEKKIIKERLSDTKKMSELAVCKIQHFWLLPEENTKSETFSNKTYKIFNHELKYSSLEKVALKINAFIYFITLFMCFIGVILNRKKIYKDNSIFFVILFVTTFFVYLLIEINPKYIYFILISIFILSSYGYDYVLSKIKGALTHEK